MTLMNRRVTGQMYIYRETIVDGEECETEFLVHLDGEMAPAERDVGIMRDYVDDLQATRTLLDGTTEVVELTDSEMEHAVEVLHQAWEDRREDDADRRYDEWRDRQMERD